MFSYNPYGSNSPWAREHAAKKAEEAKKAQEEGMARGALFPVQEVLADIRHASLRGEISPARMESCATPLPVAGRGPRTEGAYQGSTGMHCRSGEVWLRIAEPDYEDDAHTYVLVGTPSAILAALRGMRVGLSRTLHQELREALTKKFRF